MDMQTTSNLSSATAGIHHVTAICSDAQQNIDFFCGILGLRLVKITVNFDDPGSYHLYFGDEGGSPGSLLTFFVWPGAAPSISPAAIAAVRLAAPRESMDFWLGRLQNSAVPCRKIQSVDGSPAIHVTAPDGLHVELVSGAECRPPASAFGVIPAAAAIGGIAGVVFASRRKAESAFLFSSELGLRAWEPSTGELPQTDILLRPSTGSYPCVAVTDRSKAATGHFAPGMIHHVAFRARDEAQQAAFRNGLIHARHNATEPLNRVYFRSIYFLEPGGAVCEIATDGPGFAVDEPLMELGRRLCLPPWLEDQRPQILQRLPPLNFPDGRSGSAVTSRRI